MERRIKEVGDGIRNCVVGAVILPNEVEISPWSSVNPVTGSASRHSTFE